MKNRSFEVELDAMNCREKARKLIEEMHPEDLENIVPVLEHITELRETLDVASDPDALKDIGEAREEFKQGKGKTLDLSKV